MGNVQTVQKIYDAFEKGDIPTILAELSESVDWEYRGGSTEVPWLQQRKGREGATAFFGSLAGIQIESFVPKAFLEGDHVVVVLLDLEFTVKKTGKRVVEEDEVHIWWFDDEGAVVRFRHQVDTHQHHLALQP